MPDIAKAYVQVIPSAEGISGELNNVMSGAGESGGNAFNTSFGSVLKKVATSAAIVGAAKAVGKVFSESISAASDYEQLIGGVETLYGTAAGLVEQYATNAYETAGMSANDYMETVTSFAASLKQSFADAADGEQLAAEVGNMAVTDMADNANKMGTSMEAVQNAYQGFAKGNYTMLDNLKLGYGGTQSEMERLLADASELSGVEYDISNLADVYNAIHVIQTDLGITGTTAEEAAETMSGSLASMKASWTNVLAAMAGQGDLSAALEGLVGSAQNVVTNLSPMLGNIFQGLLTAIGTLLPQLAVIVPQITDVLLKNLPLLIDGAVQLLFGIIEAIPIIIPQIVSALPAIVSSIARAVGEAAPLLVAAAAGLAENVVAAIPTFVVDIVFAVGELLTSLISSIAEYGAKMVQAGKDFFNGFITGLNEIVPHIIEKAKGFCSDLVNAVKEFLGIHSPSKVMAGIGVNVGKGLAEGITSTEGLVNSSATRLASAAMGSFGTTSSWSGSGLARSNSTQITINAKQLSQQDIDYIVNNANRRMGVMT